MIEDIVRSARAALAAAPPVGAPEYPRYCRELAGKLRSGWKQVLDANAEDLAAAEARGLPAALLDRLRLTDRHLAVLERLTASVHDALPAATAPGPEEPIGSWGTRRLVRKPLGVVLMVYEARPTVTVEGALMAVATGNAVLLRGGREIAATNAALAGLVRAAAGAAGLPAAMATVLDDADRRQLRWLLAHPDSVDVLVPRGGPSLIDYCRTATSIPVIASGGGVNHLYVDRSADLDLAARIALDSKLSEPTACNTLELVLVDAERAADLTGHLVDAVAVDGRPATLRLHPSLTVGREQPGNLEVVPLEEHDLGREFLDPAVGVLPVNGLEPAVAHIRRYGTGHTEGVVAEDPSVVERFVRLVDAAALVVNGSLRLHDGPTLGLGPELSISTGRLHVRGSVTLASLLTYSHVVSARGTLRDGPRRPSAATATEG